MAEPVSILMMTVKVIAKIKEMYSELKQRDLEILAQLDRLRALAEVLSQHAELSKIDPKPKFMVKVDTYLTEAISTIAQIISELEILGGYSTVKKVVTNKDLKEDIGRCLRSCDSAVNEILLHTTLEQNKMLSRASGAFSKSATVQEIAKDLAKARLDSSVLRGTARQEALTAAQSAFDFRSDNLCNVFTQVGWRGGTFGDFINKINNEYSHNTPELYSPMRNWVETLITSTRLPAATPNNNNSNSASNNIANITGLSINGVPPTSSADEGKAQSLSVGTSGDLPVPWYKLPVEERIIPVPLDPETLYSKYIQLNKQDVSATWPYQGHDDARARSSYAEFFCWLAREGRLNQIESDYCDITVNASAKQSRLEAMALALLLFDNPFSALKQEIDITTTTTTTNNNNNNNSNDNNSNSNSNPKDPKITHVLNQVKQRLNNMHVIQHLSVALILAQIDTYYYLKGGISRFIDDYTGGKRTINNKMDALAVYLTEGSPLDDAKQILDKYSLFGLPTQLVKAGNLYRLGLIVNKDNKKALHHYLLAAKYGEPAGMMNAGLMFRVGMVNAAEVAFDTSPSGTPSPGPELLSPGTKCLQRLYSKKATSDTDSDAIATAFFELAVLQNNNNIRITEQKTKEIVVKPICGGPSLDDAAKDGYDMKIQIEGNAVGKYNPGFSDDDLAHVYYQLGVAYQNGLGVTKSIGKAVQYYVSSATLGYVGSLLCLAGILSELKGDYTKVKEMCMLLDTALYANKPKYYNVDAVDNEMKGGGNRSEEAKQLAISTIELLYSHMLTMRERPCLNDLGLGVQTLDVEADLLLKEFGMAAEAKLGGDLNAAVKCLTMFHAREDDRSFIQTCYNHSDEYYKHEGIKDRKMWEAFKREFTSGGKSNKLSTFSLLKGFIFFEREFESKEITTDKKVESLPLTQDEAIEYLGTCGCFPAQRYLLSLVTREVYEDLQGCSPTPYDKQVMDAASKSSAPPLTPDSECALALVFWRCGSRWRELERGKARKIKLVPSPGKGIFSFFRKPPPLDKLPVPDPSLSFPDVYCNLAAEVLESKAKSGSLTGMYLISQIQIGSDDPVKRNRAIAYLTAAKVQNHEEAVETWNAREKAKMELDGSSRQEEKGDEGKGEAAGQGNAFESFYALLANQLPRVPVALEPACKPLQDTLDKYEAQAKKSQGKK